MACSDEWDDVDAYASPPCFLHELDPSYLGLPTSPQSPTVIAAWRKAERRRLIASRLAISPADRAAATERIAAAPHELLANPSGHVIGAFWPILGEVDLRGWMGEVIALGARCALPTVNPENVSLEFRPWVPGDALQPEARGVPVPTIATSVTLDVVIVPLVGFAPDRHRLGYGDGLYDRTLASLTPRPQIIGVGFMEAAIPTINPLPHDIAMDLIVTESGVFRG